MLALPCCLLLLPALALAASCPGCPEQVDSLSSSQEALVTWAVAELQGEGGTCPRQRLQVNNFSSQVVAGALYKFDLVLNHSDGEGCKGSEETETCTLVVWEQTWRDFREVQWDKSSCRKGQK